MNIATQFCPQAANQCLQDQSPVYRKIDQKVFWAAGATFTAFLLSPAITLTGCMTTVLTIESKHLKSIVDKTRRLFEFFKKEPAKSSRYLHHSHPSIENELNQSYELVDFLSSLTPQQKYDCLHSLAGIELGHNPFPLIKNLLLTKKLALIIYLLPRANLDKQTLCHLVETCWQKAYTSSSLAFVIYICQLCEHLPQIKPLERWTICCADGVISYPIYYKHAFEKFSPYFDALKKEEGPTVLKNVKKEEFQELVEAITTNSIPKKNEAVGKSLLKWLRLYILMENYQLTTYEYTTTLTYYLNQYVPMNCEAERRFVLNFIHHLKQDRHVLKKNDAAAYKRLKTYIESFKIACLASILKDKPTYYHQPITKRDIEFLKELKLKRLHFFDFPYCKWELLTDRLFQELLPTFQQVNSLSLSFMTELTDQTLRDLSHTSICSNLQFLDLRQTSFSPKAVSTLLANCTRLNDLTLPEYEEWPRPRLDLLKDYEFCRHLTNLTFKNYGNYFHAGFRTYDEEDSSMATFIQSCSNLQFLSLKNYQNLDRTLSALSDHCTNLTHLELEQVSFSPNAFLSLVKNRTNLQVLRLTNCSYLKRDWVIHIVKTATQLKHLDIISKESFTKTVEEKEEYFRMLHETRPDLFPNL